LDTPCNDSLNCCCKSLNKDVEIIDRFLLDVESELEDTIFYLLSTFTSHLYELKVVLPKETQFLPNEQANVYAIAKLAIFFPPSMKKPTLNALVYITKTRDSLGLTVVGSLLNAFIGLRLNFLIVSFFFFEYMPSLPIRKMNTYFLPNIS
jgi:hypothetical protein